MRLAFSIVEDEEEARDLHRVALPGDVWQGKDCTTWVVKNDKAVCGLLMAKFYGPNKTVYLKVAAVPLRFRGRGIYQRMLRHLSRWVRKHDAVAIATYTLLHNYESIGGLLKSGFRFVRPERGAMYVGPHVHYFVKKLPKRSHRPHKI